MRGRENKWLLFLLAYAVSTLLFGLVFSFGALFLVILETFDTDRATGAVVQALLMGVTSCFCVFSGVINGRFSLHIVILVSGILVTVGFSTSFFVSDIIYLFFTIGILAGTGISLAFICCITTTSAIFTGRQKALCVAIFNTNVPVAGVFYPYLLQWLSELYGLKGTFLILGGLFCNTFAFSLLTRVHRSYLTDKVRNGSKESSDQCTWVNVVKIVKTMLSKHYVCLLIASSISTTALNGYVELAFDIAKWKDLNDSQAKSTFVIFNCVSCIMSIFPGLLKQRLDIDIFFYPFLLGLFGISGSTTLYFTRSYSMYVFGTALMSAMYGIISCSYIICTHLVPQEHLGVAIGLIQTVVGLLSIGTGPTFGGIRDRLGSYDSVILVIGVVQTSSALLFMAAFVYRTVNKPTTVQV